MSYRTMMDTAFTVPESGSGTEGKCMSGLWMIQNRQESTGCIVAVVDIIITKAWITPNAYNLASSSLLQRLRTV